ncbi:hypothetical protein METBIDRAFT_201841 [Metschnikowia bicuspidata var. bicuspidata NRRL YB-4993]|uniref:Uncharacterized protein n=1 Tax=Metschnikowia bicuspidata var. bicuspidata NRRL YB-4993 TaxID=869754 RepID=A0A1A0H933_9ASCO|nr:hypothetical protein METBIDRAFT_201841 [Metschnikowia bicuspidata var. bicuspidata NRRL YB-4993]OBA20634.1 hypothetical protein METBIDRAFT_201841 [Metschnikowia bicuspidata var. bicuspidata NRRL YB-4993]
MSLQGKLPERPGPTPRGHASSASLGAVGCPWSPIGGSEVSAGSSCLIQAGPGSPRVHHNRCASVRCVQ